ncbi:MAG: hypothetical protein QG589_287 [Patescibacteria group bacterium]|nr:hypothetical protein [Patescibacteria group bacterium]
MMFALVLPAWVVPGTVLAVPVAPSCNTEATQTIVSDSATLVGGNPSVATWVHPGWTSIPGATWIWDTVEVPEPTIDQTRIFTRTFSVTGSVTSASLQIAADNGFLLKVNGDTVDDKLAIETNFSSVATYDIASKLHSGSNTIEVTVKNFALAGADSHTNPAGLLYKLDIKNNECDVPPTTATIVATKIVCDNISDLPKWGNGGPDITASTVSSFLESHKTCHVQKDWQFQWGPSDAPNPGSNITSPAGNPWTTFGPTDVNGVVQTEIPAGTKAWFREVLQNDYVPFSDNTSGQAPQDEQSAEMYCGTDVLNYDNYEFIDPVVAGTTYYCVAFNVKNKVSPPPSSSVKLCKTDDAEKPLSGWTLILKGKNIQTGLSVPVNSSGGVNSNPLVAGMSYIATASGTWMNQGGANQVDPEYSSTDNWLTHMDGYTGYQTDILELQINNTFDPQSDWGLYNDSHTYMQSFVPASSGPANFRIFDGSGTVQNESWFNDNSGSLSVNIDEGYLGVTGQDGCVLFDQVPYGDYVVGEVGKPGWTNVSGLGAVTINEPTHTVVVVNHDTTVPAPVCDAQVELIKNGSFEKPTVADASWNIFPSGTTDLDWVVKWFGGSATFGEATRPDVANIELQHNGLNSWTASDGMQWAELDTDWDGPSGSLSGEPAPVDISQTIDTIPGKKYKLRFDFSARPDTSASENKLEVLYNGSLVKTVGPKPGVSHVVWEPKTVVFTATTTKTSISFRDAGTPEDSLGPFLDNVSLRCMPHDDDDEDTDHPVDVCSNIQGVQVTVPEGRVLRDGQCIVPEVDDGGDGAPTDLCSNIEGVQEVVPAGMVANGNICQTPQPQSVAPQSSNNGGGGGNGPIIGSLPQGKKLGSVLGASTVKDDSLPPSCSLYLTTYMRFGKKNDPAEVKKLQTFLNEYLGLNIPVTGVFGLQTLAGVNKFQIKEGLEVLGPWVKAGLHKSEQEPTGYVYKTTQRRINLIKCTTLSIPQPQLP